jgi:hypothetical protein
MKSIANPICGLLWIVLLPLGCNPPDSDRLSDLESRLERLERGDTGRTGKLEKLFAAMDVNSNKRVSPAEFEQHTRRNFTILLGRMDADGDGVISKEEFAKRRTEDVTSKLFALDRDQDHLVTREEASRSEELWFLQRLGNLITASKKVLSAQDMEDHFTQTLVNFCTKTGCAPEISEANYLKWHLPVYDDVDFNGDDKIVYAELRRHKQDTAARMLAAQHSTSRGFEYVGPGLLCVIGGTRCIGFHLPEPGGGGGGYIDPSGGQCAVCDPSSAEYDDFMCIYMGEIVNCGN